MVEERPFEVSVEEDWDFKRADTQYWTHGLHLYPARMVPQIAKRLIARHATEPSDKVLDPFCGSGGVLVEAILAGKKAYGTDVNPLAILLAQVKTKPLDVERLEKEKEKLLREVDKGINSLRQSRLDVELPEEQKFPHLLFWFKKPVAKELTIICQSIKSMEEPELLDFHRFFEVCFSMTAIKVSNIDVEDNPYFIRSMKGEKLERHKPDALGVFKTQVADSVTRMKQYVQACGGYVEPEIRLHDSRDLKPVIGDDFIKLVVTSPPYGEEKRTMAYMSFSKLSLYWLGHTPEDLRESSRMRLGGVVPEKAPDVPSPTLKNALAEIGKKDPKAAMEVLAFFDDYFKVIKEMHRVLKPGGHACIVIGNRNVRGVPVLNDEVTAELGQAAGLERDGIMYRNIPKKVLPRSDGRIELINRESIVILRKQL